jgi:hypothetical protein
VSRVYRAEPRGRRRLVVAPTRSLTEKDLATCRSLTRDYAKNAPIRELPERFKAAMKAKGWLR